MSFEFDFTPEKLSQILSNNSNVDQWYDALIKMLPEYGIVSLLEVAQFLAQTGHESAGYSVLKENLNYRWESLRRVFPKYFPTDEIAKQYERKPEMIANRAYGNRMGNGPEESGDGFRYCGRGLIQLTGKYNYQNLANSIEMPLEELPEYLLTFDGAVQSACWYWTTHNISEPANAGDTKRVTQIINGGQNGFDDRLARYNRALDILQG